MLRSHLECARHLNSWARLLLPLFVFIAILVSYPSSVRAAAAEATIDDFITQHWNKPIAPQGDAPDNLSDLEKDLSPDSCGACHPQQFQDWRDSLHAHAMGPGLVGQLMQMVATDRAQHQTCISCHAPLSEQADSLVVELSKGSYDNKTLPTPDNSKKLHERGMICAACHVRDYHWYGPPRKDGSTVASSESKFPHGGWTSVKAFADSRFCSTCHQFKENGYALNGKLLENTYQEWQASSYPEQGISCQKCHMPDRRHLWRGIHDAEMTRSGVTIETSSVKVDGDRIVGTIKITNSNTGHYFPTYITPLVWLQGMQLDQDGEPVEGSSQQYPIGRNLPLNLASENYDTRLAPGQKLEIEYDAAKATAAKTLLLRVRVEPDEFYNRFYQSLLANNPPGKQTEMIKQALVDSEKSIYTLFEQQFKLQ